MNAKMFLALSSIIPLAACGGSSTDESSFESLSDRGYALIEEYQDAELTTEEAMPTSGTATYSGIAAFSQDSDIYNDVSTAEVISEASLTANFAENSISGQLSNFQAYYAEDAMGGSLAIENGAISGNVFTADLSGQITDEGELNVVDGTMAGGFVGDNAEALVAGIDATTTTAQYGTEAIYGVLGAEVQ